MDINLVLALFAGVVLLLSAFSTLFHRVSFPGPVIALLSGVLIGPYALGLIRIEDFGQPTSTLLEESCRITLAVGLTGVALRLPHGYWRANLRWVTVIIGLGMLLMLVVATGILWVLLGLPFLLALLLGAVITPTDPVVTTPIVTGSLAEERVPGSVRLNLTSESGLNDGLGSLLVMAPVLVLTTPEAAARELLTTVLLWEILGATAFGAVAGYATGKLFVLARRKKLMEESSYIGFVVPLGLFILGVGGLLGTNEVLAVFVAAAVFGQIIPERDEQEEGKVDDAINRFFLLPVFILLGMALPIQEWLALGWPAPAALLLAVLGRRLLALAMLRPLLKGVHNRPETLFIGWFGPIGASALFYATMAERPTGDPEIFVYTTLAVTLSVLVHGLSSSPMSLWLAHRKAQRSPQPDLSVA